MGGRAVAHVPGEAILRVEFIECDHETITIDFGNNRGSRDGIHIAVAFDEGGLGTGQVTQRAAVDQDMLGRHRQLLHGEAHRLEPSLVNVDPVDFLDLDHTDSHTTSNLADLGIQPLSGLGRQGFRIAHPLRKRAGRFVAGRDMRKNDRSAARISALSLLMVSSSSAARGFAPMA